MLKLQNFFRSKTVKEEVLPEEDVTKLDEEKGDDDVMLETDELNRLKNLSDKLNLATRRPSVLQWKQVKICSITIYIVRFSLNF